ncbi:MAG: hypothetical protein ACE5HP_00440 [Gemmatimonadota bacterium]
MQLETTTTRSPREVIRAAKEFLLGEASDRSVWLERESDTHLSLATFRGNLVVAAFPDPEAAGTTRVRVSTLRRERVAPRLLTFLGTLDSRG